MSLHLAFSRALVILFATAPLSLQAQTRDTKVPDVIKDPPSINQPDVKGALRVEDKPAIPPEELQKIEDSVPQPPKEVPTAKKGSPHFFGFHGAIGLPHPVSYGLNYVHPSGILSGEFNMGSYGLKSGTVEVGMSHMQLGLRWHPFVGAFFLGANYGQRTISGQSSETINTIPVTVKIEVKSNYLMPQLGWIWGIADGGFFMSLELGYLSPSGVKTSFRTNVDDPLVTGTSDYAKLEKDVKDAGDKLGSIGLPSMTLLKFGWLF